MGFRVQGAQVRNHASAIVNRLVLDNNGLPVYDLRLVVENGNVVGEDSIAEKFPFSRILTLVRRHDPLPEHLLLALAAKVGSPADSARFKIERAAVLMIMRSGGRSAFESGVEALLGTGPVGTENRNGCGAAGHEGDIFHRSGAIGDADAVLYRKSRRERQHRIFYEIVVLIPLERPRRNEKKGRLATLVVQPQLDELDCPANGVVAE